MTNEMNNPIDTLSRRTFIKLSAIAGAGLMVNPLTTIGKDPSNESIAFIKGMIPACLLLQTAGLAQKAIFTNRDVKKALDFSIYLTKESNFAFAGLLPHEWSAISETSFADLPKERQAFKAGLVVSDVANEYFSKIYSDCNQKDVSELRLYHNACLIRNVSGVNVGQTTKEELTEFFRTLVSPMITRTHTLRPNRDDGMDWIVQMTRWNRAYYSYSQQLAETITEPEPVKEDRYIKKTNFMNLSDNSIRYAIGEDELRELAQIQDNRSLYGKALYESLRRVCDSFK